MARTSKKKPTRAAKKKPARKAPAKKAVKKIAAKKPVQKAASKKPAGKKAASKKPVAKKTAPKKSVAKKAAPKKPAAKKGPQPVPVHRFHSVNIPQMPEVDGYVRNLPPPVKPLVNELRRIVREAAPEAHEIFMGGPAYAANGLFARIEARDRDVLVEFLKGAALQAPEGVLTGKGPIRQMSITAINDVRENVLRTLVRQAVLINLSPDPVDLPSDDGPDEEQES